MEKLTPEQLAAKRQAEADQEAKHLKELQGIEELHTDLSYKIHTAASNNRNQPTPSWGESQKEAAVQLLDEAAKHPECPPVVRQWLERFAPPAPTPAPSEPIAAALAVEAPEAAPAEASDPDSL